MSQSDKIGGYNANGKTVLKLHKLIAHNCNDIGEQKPKQQNDDKGKRMKNQ